MELHRRSFLKGMGTLSGVAASGVTFDAMAAYSWVNDILISPADSRTLDERRAWHAIGHRAGLVTPHLTDSRH